MMVIIFSALLKLDADLSLKGMSGQFQQFAMKKAKTDYCSGKTAPVEVSKIDGDRITFTVKLSNIMTQCNDSSATFCHICANGKSGLAPLNSDEGMSVKK